MAAQPEQSLPSASCDGGPHLLLPKDLVEEWHGTEGAQGDDFTGTDYGRACEIYEPISLLRVGSGNGLLVGDSPPFTYWVAHSDGAGGDLVVPTYWTEEFTDLDLQNACGGAPDSALTDVRLVFEHSSSSCLLFGACDAGPDWVYGFAEVSLPAGSYGVRSGEVDAAPDLRLQVFRLLKQQ